MVHCISRCFSVWMHFMHSEYSVFSMSFETHLKNSDSCSVTCSKIINKWLFLHSAWSKRCRTLSWRSGSTIRTAWTSGFLPWSFWPIHPTSWRTPSPRSKTTSTNWAWRGSTLCSSWSRRRRAQRPTPTNSCGQLWPYLLNELHPLVGWTGRSGYGLWYLIAWRTSL